MIYPNFLKPALLAGVAVAAVAWAGANQPGPRSVETLNFLAQGSMAEIQLGHLAQQKSNNPVVQKLAQRIIEDHTALLENVRRVAEQQNVTLPAGPNAEQRAAFQRLEALSGKPFNDAYVRMMLKDHQMDIQMLSQQKPMIHDRAVFSLVQTTQPILENHIRAAEHAAGELRISARGGFNRPVHPVGTMPPSQYQNGYQNGNGQ